jgi:ferredoxin, 2Fe-2S
LQRTFRLNAIDVPRRSSEIITPPGNPNRNVSIIRKTTMATVTYISFDGEEHHVELAPGQSVMQGAVNNNVRGIIGDCGGSCSCATCHVYVDLEWLDKLDAKSETEEILLEEVCDPQDNSRLSCQIKISEDLDGLIVRLPEKQV